MKKILLILICVVFSNCDIKPRGVNAQQQDLLKSDFDNHPIYSYREEWHSGMLYGVWYVNHYSSQTGYAAFATNISKDQLEMTVLRQKRDCK